MIKSTLLQHLSLALQQAAPQLNHLTVDDSLLSNLRLERPRSPEHGDYAVNISFLARSTKMPPPKIATILQEALNTRPEFSCQAIGGYLNFKLHPSLLQTALFQLLQTPHFGENPSQTGANILLEYVSANPTGPLHIGHGRWAALGDSIARILRASGAQVTTEFYINDAGVQMRNIGLATFLRCREILVEAGQLPASIHQQYPLELPYPGDYVLDLARAFLQQHPAQQSALLEYWQGLLSQPVPGFSLESIDTRQLQPFMEFARTTMLATQRTLLDAMRVHFDRWTSEKADLYDQNLIPDTVAKLGALGYTYEAEDALWFKSTEFGDEKDRVLRKSDGSYTYLTPDIAYHHDKFTRPQHYNRVLNIWGADHHGYITRMRGAITALGHPPEAFEVLLGQLVNLIVDGERTRMGKRRRMLTLQDVVDEVGVDATRFWMVSKSADNTLDFDVDLAASASHENPVFYVQYAHARCASILRNATEASPNAESGEWVPAFIEPEALTQFEASLHPEALAPLFDALHDQPREQAVLTTLLLLLDHFPETVADAARLRAPHFITQYVQEVASQFHSFYNICRILTPKPPITLARLMLIRAIQKVLTEALWLLGVSAPEKM